MFKKQKEGKWKNGNRKKIEFEKWHAIRASVGGVAGVFAWVRCKRGLRGWCASVNKVVGGVLR